MPTDLPEAVAHLLTAEDAEAAWDFTVVIVPTDPGGNVRGMVNRIRTAVAKGIGKHPDYIGTSCRTAEDDVTHTIGVYRKTDAEAAEVKRLRDAKRAAAKGVTVAPTVVAATEPSPPEPKPAKASK